MKAIHPFAPIADVQLAALRPWTDERGQFTELFRKEWFPQRSWERMQSNRSFSRAGVLRGLHYHRKQVDYWYVMDGRLRVGLADLRPDSETYLKSATLEMSGEEPRGLFIPVGVAHGFVALTDVTLMYIVDNYYDGDDELGVAWDDPQLAVAWQVNEPIVSDRDAANPTLAQILAERTSR